MSETAASRPSATRRWALAATGLSVVVASILIVAKLLGWAVTGSAAVLGSLADSALDLIGSGVALMGVRWAAQPADAEHRFGHDKAEAISSLTQIVLITGSACYVLYESVSRLFAPEPISQGNVALGVMGLSLALSIGLVSFQTLAIRKTGSLAVEGDRAHYAGDLLANAGALVAVVLAVELGWLRADALAGLAAGLFLIWAAFSIGRRAVPQLMDEELSSATRERILAIVRADPDIRGAHALRTRLAGDRRHIQMHIELDGDLTLRESHVITDRVEVALYRAFPGADVILHQDPYGESEPHDRYGARLDIDERLEEADIQAGSASTPD